MASPNNLQPRRWHKSTLREPFASASHLLGVVASVIGMGYLLSASKGSALSISVITIYCSALITLFLTSGLFHGLRIGERGLLKLERLDHAAIYVMIAGTYTPLCYFGLKGNIGLAMFCIQWTLALIGVWLSLSRGPCNRFVQVCIYLAMSWSFLFVLPSLFTALAPLPFNLLILGLGIYSIGTLFFLANCPNLFRTRISSHDCWHVFVLLGSGTHYALVALIIS